MDAYCILPFFCFPGNVLRPMGFLELGDTDHPWDELVYLPTKNYLIKINKIHVGKYVSPMDGMGQGLTLGFVFLVIFFTDSTMVNHHFSSPFFGEYVWFTFFSRIILSTSKKT